MLGTVITKKGVMLLTKLMATKGVLNFTRISVGTGKILSGYDPSEMIDLVQYKMDGVISRCYANNDIVKLTMQISSAGLESGFVLTEVGVYAEDPDLGEILYSYIDLSDDPQYIYAEGGMAIKFVEITLEVVVTAETKVTAYINPASMITRDELKDELAKKEKELQQIIEPEFDDSGNVTEITDKSTLLDSLISKMPLVKFMRNVKAGFKLALYAGEMVNDCVTNRPDLPLSAAQGKALMDLYTKLYSDIVKYKALHGADRPFNVGDIIPVDRIPLFLMVRFGDIPANKVLLFRFSNLFMSSDARFVCILQMENGGKGLSVIASYDTIQGVDVIM